MRVCFRNEDLTWSSLGQPDRRLGEPASHVWVIHAAQSERRQPGAFRSGVVADALSRSGITRLLDRMERDGLISRTVSTTDRRRFDVSLTPSGQQRFEQAWPAHAEGIGRYLVQPLAPRDIGELAWILDSLVQASRRYVSIVM